MRRSKKLILLLYLFSGVFHGYLALRLVPDLMAWPILAISLLNVILGCIYIIPAALIRTQAPHSQLNRLIVWSGFFAMGWVSTVFVLSLLRDFAIALLWLLSFISNAEFSNLIAPYWSALFITLCATMVSMIGLLNVLVSPKVVEVDVAIENLPKGLQGFRIVQLSDIHVGPTIKDRFIHKVVNKSNTLNADMIALTGDLVDGRVKHLANHIRPLKNLRSRYGSFFVTGNHEYYSNAVEWIAEFKQLGFHILQNQHHVIAHNEEALVVAGVTDYSAHNFYETHASDPQKALVNAPESASVKLLLAHQPRSIFKAVQHGYHLQLSGHTHGGQFWPWNWLVPLQQPFTSGLHMHRHMWIYTSRGTGYWGPPKRFGAPAEITLLRLISAN